MPQSWSMQCEGMGLCRQVCYISVQVLLSESLTACASLETPCQRCMMPVAGHKDN